MKLSRVLLQAILVGVTIGGAASCQDDIGILIEEAQAQQAAAEEAEAEEVLGENDDRGGNGDGFCGVGEEGVIGGEGYDCAACGMG